MDAEKPSGSNESDATRPERYDEAGPSRISAVDTSNPAEVAAVEQTGDIFKLDIDCFRETFDFLPLKDLANVGKTCKQLLQVAGYCFQKNYLGRAVYSSNGILCDFDIFELGFNLIPFVRVLKMSRSGYHNFLRVRPKFKHLKEIHFFDLIVHHIWEISVDELEVLSVTDCFANNLYEIINKCAKLRCLMVKWCHGEYCGGEYNWIDRKYPPLEYFKLQPRPMSKGLVKGIAMFLEINPNIRKFATSAKLLWRNRDEFASANVQLDDLAILSNCEMSVQCQKTIDFLNTLHERGFYKKLQLYYSHVLNQKQVNRLATLNGLNKLGHLDIRHNALDLSAFQNIEELYRPVFMETSISEMLSTALINLKRIYFDFMSIDVIVPFIRRSVRMHRIKLSNLKPGFYFNEDTKVIGLRALNREREQLPDAQKITLLVEEDIYLATKWALGDIDLRSIRIKRDTSFDWFHDFE